MKASSGVTLAELIIAMSIIGVLALLSGPAINEFLSDFRARSAATDLAESLTLSRAMAIKENRTYTVSFIQTNGTYKVCKDADNDNFPETLVKTVTLPDYGNNIRYGTAATVSPVSPVAFPNHNCTNLNTVTAVSIDPTGGFGFVLGEKGAIYIQKGPDVNYSVCIRSFAGNIGIWKWEQNQWISIR